MILLEHISYSGTAGGYRPASQSNGTVLRSEQAGNEIQKSGFPHPEGPTMDRNSPGIRSKDI